MRLREEEFLGTGVRDRLRAEARKKGERERQRRKCDISMEEVIDARQLKIMVC